jgi:hypothetical protein
LQALAESFDNPEASAAERLDAAARLIQGVKRYGARPPKPNQPKLPTLGGLIQHCRAVFKQQPPGSLRTAAAQALGVLYQQTHAIYKPDEHAANRTARLYREKHPAANHAAEAIVIYPTDRIPKRDR